VIKPARLKFLPIFIILFSTFSAYGADWPTWRHDAGRSGVTTEKLPARLHLLWSLRLPAPRPAWPDSRLRFDEAYQPVIAGKLLFLGSSHNDSVCAYSTKTGKEKWRFYADGPVRAAPLALRGKLYFVSDDGYLYCLNARTGKLLWKFFGAHSGKKVLGNERLISMWPARGGPVIDGNNLYFGAGVWPFMGAPIYCLNANTGKVIWQNDRASMLYYEMGERGTTSFGGTSPQGSLLIINDKLIIPTGRAWPVSLDKKTGRTLPYQHGCKETGGGGYSRLGSAGDFLVMGKYVFDITQWRPLVFNASPSRLTPFNSMSLMDKDILYVSTKEGVETYNLKNAPMKKYSGGFGVRPLRCDTKKLWTFPSAKPITCMIKAGDRLYAGRSMLVMAINTKSGAGKEKRSWKKRISGKPVELAVADGKLFVSTLKGRIYCFGGKYAPTKRHIQEAVRREDTEDELTRQGDEILKITGITEGYCIVAGLKSGRLLERLLRKTKLHVIGVGGNEKVIRALRKRLDDAGLLGTRAAVHMGDPLAFGFPPYMASLIVSEDSGQVASSTVSPSGLLKALRPFGGTACLNIASDQRASFANGVKNASLESMQLKTDGKWTLVTRTGPLPGAADWTHEAADPGNTWMGRDKRVKGPLGILWFGGPAGAADLYSARTTNPPTARVVDGRMFIQGRGKMTAVDVYTGRVLWQQRLPGEKHFSNVRSYAEGGIFAYASGGTAVRPWLVAHKDGIYLVYGTKIHLMDNATGKIIKEFAIPDDKSAGKSLHLGHIWIWKDVIIVGAEYDTTDVESDFIAADFSKTPKNKMSAIFKVMAGWAPVAGYKKAKGETDATFAVRCFNRLLNEKDIDKSIPAKFKAMALKSPDIKKNAAVAQSKLNRYKRRAASYFSPFFSLASHNRRLLEAYFPTVRKNPKKLYFHNLFPWDGEYTQQIVALDRKTGKELWRQRAKYSFPQKSISLGNGKVFCLDRVDIDVLDYLKRRGIGRKTNPRVLALDIYTGKTAWSHEGDIDGYQTFYSADYDILVQPTPYDPDPALWGKKRKQGVRYLARRGANGKVLWDKKLKIVRSSGRHRMWYHWFLHKNVIITESYSDIYSDYYGMQLETGERINRISPLTGENIDWSFKRKRGCGKNLSCENLVLFRSTTAGYYDIAGDSGTANLSGFRSGCKISLIPAAGIINAPNFASGCVCNFPIFTSLALIHMKDVEGWSSNAYKYDGASVKRIGINFGAPGDFRADSGTLWVDYPSVGGESPDLPIRITPAKPAVIYHHSSRIISAPLISITVAKKPKSSTVDYTVRLHFSELVEKQTGKRIFNVSVQNKMVLRNFDICREANGPGRGIVREIKNVKASNEIIVKLEGRKGKTIISGIELIAN